MTLNGARTYRLDKEEMASREMAIDLVHLEPTFLQIQKDDDLKLTEYGAAAYRDVKKRTEKLLGVLKEVQEEPNEDNIDPEQHAKLETFLVQSTAKLRKYQKDLGQIKRGLDWQG